MAPKKKPMRSLSTSARNFRKNSASNKNKNERSKEVNKRPVQVAKRVKSNKMRREAKRKGINIKGKDYDHAVKKFVKSETNRGRSGEGGRKKKKK
tara:strand:- start:4 stop:288 length:285 start_codon:yes stop_codon:yes gene_type:complete